VISGQRKGYTAWSRSYAFAATRPQRGQVRLGLALTPSASPRLQRAQREGWSQRLKSTLLLTQAWRRRPGGSCPAARGLGKELSPRAAM
jgi:hypothetical protein